jgi:hypothetical protein
VKTIEMFNDQKQTFTAVAQNAGKGDELVSAIMNPEKGRLS